MVCSNLIGVFSDCTSCTVCTGGEGGRRRGGQEEKPARRRKRGGGGGKEEEKEEEEGERKRKRGGGGAKEEEKRRRRGKGGGKEEEEEKRRRKRGNNSLISMLWSWFCIPNVLIFKGESYIVIVKKQNFRLRRQGVENKGEKGIDKGLVGQNSAAGEKFLGV